MKKKFRLNKKTIITGIIILLIIICIIFINNNHYNAITCTNIIKEDTYTINDKYKIYYKRDIANKVVIEREINSKNTTVLAFFEKNYKDEFKKYNDEYGGYKIDSIKDNKKAVVKIEFEPNKAKVYKLLKSRSYLKKDVVGKDKKMKLKVSGVYKLFNLNKNSCK